MARKCKDTVCRRVYSFRLTPDAHDVFVVTANKLGVSVSDLIQNYAMHFCKDRLDYDFPCVFWS